MRPEKPASSKSTPRLQASQAIVVVNKKRMFLLLKNYRHVRWTYKSYFFSQRTVFFSHNKLANGTFSHGLSAKRTDSQKLETQNPTEA